ncbi:hypothetical protein NHX12_005384 [Muraenolepis orangiensis]|uniref:Cell cycle progression protein 1 n=1 Tax=Muraenolepis orangiensis TaxID=630683 RepID=A0A9Q0DRC3_9TELE|nr:hypothetical protein NHX12_005384 [Muraenolepis orangiensis]
MSETSSDTESSCGWTLISNEGSDIETLGPENALEHGTDTPGVTPVPEPDQGGAAAKEHVALCSSKTVLPAQPPLGTHSSSSSEDESPGSTATVPRRRRPRRNTSSPLTDPEEEGLESGEARCGLNTGVLLAMVVAVAMALGHYYGNDGRLFEKPRIFCAGPESGDYEDGHQLCLRELYRDEVLAGILKDDFDHYDFVEIIKNISIENKELNTQQTLIQAQSDELVVRLKQVSEEWNDMVSQKHKLTTENQLLKSSLGREEQSLLALQEELRNLHSKITELEDRGSAVDSLVLENQKLKDQLEEKKTLTRGVLSQREAAMAETRTLRKELDRERKFTKELRVEMEQLASSSAGAEESQAEIQTRLMELEKKLGFEQQRSDLWERLYVETKEEKAKGEPQPRVKKTKEGVAGTVKETFDAVKNSTKEFVHHHKEQIKKAKEAVKENLRKFSDSVKSTFRHFKDSASTFINKATAESSEKFHKRDAEGPWQHRPQYSRSTESTGGFRSSQNTRKSGDKVKEDGDTQNHQAPPKGCAGVFDCAYQESMNLFHKGMEPVRADEFNQLLQSYLQQEVDNFHHWKALSKFINNFFHNGVFIHDQMLFKDFVSRLEDYLENMHTYYGLDEGVFEDLDEFIYRHFYGDTYTKSYGPSRPMEGPEERTKEKLQAKQQQQRKQQRARSRPQRERKCSRSGGNSDRHMADVKIELGPMPFDPKY